MQNKHYLKRLDADMRLRGLSAHTRDSYRIHVTKFLEYTRRPVEELDESDVRDFLMHLSILKCAIDIALEGLIQ